MSVREEVERLNAELREAGILDNVEVDAAGPLGVLLSFTETRKLLRMGEARREEAERLMEACMFADMADALNKTACRELTALAEGALDPKVRTAAKALAWRRVERGLHVDEAQAMEELLRQGASLK